jgi:hypothetical protein
MTQFSIDAIYKILYGQNGLCQQIEQIRLKLTECITRKTVWTAFFSSLFLIVIIWGFILDLWSTSREINKSFPKIEKAVELNTKKILQNEINIDVFKQSQNKQIILLQKIATKLDVEGIE